MLVCAYNRGLYFHEIWYTDGWVSVTDPVHPICKILGDFAKKSTQFGLNWFFYSRKWYIEGSKTCIANGEFSELDRHIHVQNLGDNPPPSPDQTSFTSEANYFLKQTILLYHFC